MDVNAIIKMRHICTPRDPLLGATNHLADQHTQYALSAAGVAFTLGQFSAGVDAHFSRIEPALRQRRTLGRARPTTLAFGGCAGVWSVELERCKQLIELFESGCCRQASASVAAHGVSLEVPGHMLANVAASAALVFEELDQQFGVTAERRGSLA